MKYARAAWWILLSTVARKLRLPWYMYWEDEASMRMFACALDFTPAEVTAAIRATECGGDDGRTAPPEPAEG